MAYLVTYYALLWVWLFVEVYANWALSIVGLSFDLVMALTVWVTNASYWTTKLSVKWSIIVIQATLDATWFLNIWLI